MLPVTGNFRLLFLEVEFLFICFLFVCSGLVVSETFKIDGYSLLEMLCVVSCRISVFLLLGCLSSVPVSALALSLMMSFESSLNYFFAYLICILFNLIVLLSALSNSKLLLSFCFFYKLVSLLRNLVVLISGTRKIGSDE